MLSCFSMQISITVLVNMNMLITLYSIDFNSTVIVFLKQETTILTATHDQFEF